MLRSGRRGELFDRLQELVSVAPVFRFSDDKTWMFEDEEEEEWLVAAGAEIDVERLLAAYELQTDADKRLLEEEWQQFLKALAVMNTEAKNAHRLANQIALVLDVVPANGNERSLSERVFQALPINELLPKKPAALKRSVEPDIDKGDDSSLQGMEIYIGSNRVRRWQFASAVLLMACVGLLTHAFMVGHFDYVAATERIPLSEIPILDVQTLDVSFEDVLANDSEQVLPEGILTEPDPSQDFATPNEFDDVMPSAEAGTAVARPRFIAHEKEVAVAKQPSAKKRKRVTLRQHVTAAGSVDTIVIEPPARAGTTPISVTLKPHPPRRIDTTLETARRIAVPDTVDLLDLDITVPSYVIDPEGRGTKRVTWTMKWQEEYVKDADGAVE